MIIDRDVLNPIRQDWESVRLKQNRIRVNMGMAFGKLSFEFSDFAYTLILIYAYSVLRDVLMQLRKEKRFTSNKNGLYHLMQGSKDTIHWIDFDQVDEGRKQRDKIAHEDLILPRGETWEYIDAIEKELVNWQIIPDIGTDYSTPYGKRGTT